MSGRSLALAVAAVLGLAAAGYALWGRAGLDDDAEFVTDAVDRGEIVAVVLATGTVNPVTSVLVGTYVSGPIAAIDVDFNSPVKKGQRVAKIDPAPFEVKVQRAQANVVTAEALSRRRAPTSSSSGSRSSATVSCAAAT